MAGGTAGRKQKKIKTHHAWYVVVMVTGWLLPPLAVLMRFGVGRDFFINIIMTLCGYIPGHVHNFYLQNIRNNRGRGRTPKWAIKAGFVKDHSKKEAREREWANRYDQNHGANTYDDDGYEDEHGNHVPAPKRSGGEALEREALARQRKQRMSSNDGLEHNLYGPNKANNGDAALNGDRDPSHFSVAGYDMLPGAGDQAKRGESKGIKQLMGRDKSSKDRFAKMEDGRQAYGTGEPEAGNEDWLNQDPLSGPRTGGGSSHNRSTNPADDPKGDDWLHKQDIYQSSMAQGERRALDRPKQQRQESDRLVGGDLHHSF